MSRVPRFHVAHSQPEKPFRTKRFRPLSTALALGLVALVSLATLSVSARRQDQSTHFEGTVSRSFSESSAKSAQAAMEFVPGDVLVRYRGGDAKARVKEITAPTLRRNGREIPVDVRRFDGSSLVDGLRLARVPAEDTLDAIAALRTDPDVLYAEPNYIRRKDALPNDARFGEVWALKNTGQQGNVGYPVNNRFINGTPGADIDAELAWNTTTGSSAVVVGIIDTGIDILHPDLVDNIWVNQGEIAGNGIDDDANGKVDDINGWDFAGNDNTVYDGGSSDPDDHGTHVAGTIGAKGNNGIGVAGVNWNVKLMSLKFLIGPDGNGTDADAIAAFNYAKMMRDRGVNLRVLNCSWGGGGNNQALKNAIESVGQSGILVVAAAGNEGLSNDDYPHYPSSFDNSNLIRVSATDRIDDLVYFSNFGTRLPGVGAPGRGILSTTPRNYGSATYTEADGSTYSFFSGTSMATPQVSGVAALILAQYPGITVQRLRGALLYSGEGIPSLADKVQSARRLNANLALINAGQALNDATPPAIGGLGVAAQTGRRVTLQFTTGDDGTAGNASLYDVYFTSSSTGVRFHVGSFIPTASGNPQSLSVLVPYKQTLGTLALTVYDKAGNNATAQVGVAVSAAASEPYTVSLSAATPLTTGGTPLALVGDDQYRFDYSLPFDFPFYGKTFRRVHVSTNGVLYFSPPETRSNGDADDVPSTNASLNLHSINLQSMIAGMWDDIRTDRFSGDVFVVIPDANRIIFRWQGSTFRDDTSPINFEIELRSDGTIQTHYGTGNANVRPLVGISGGQADSYTTGPEDSTIVASHTSTSLVNLTNAQTVTFSPQAIVQPPTLQFSQNSYSLAEGAGSLAVLVNRSGDTSVPVTVNYATADASNFLQNCNVVNGAATSRCDYVSLVGTLHFAAGENSKTLFLPVVDDTYLEGAETLFLSLSTPSGGAVIGANSSASITITDNGNDGLGLSNPIDGTNFFVRQHYIDFLGREPDPASIGWNNQINNCVPVQPSCDRLSVSQGIYSSPEFKDRGYFIYKFYSVAFGRKPTYDEFVLDRARVSGFQTEAELEQSKLDFITDFMNRPEFAVYSGLTNDQYVLTLFNLTGVSQVTVGTAVFNLSQMQQSMTTGKTRARVLREMVESPEVSARFQVESTIVMHYFGYLRR
ncbi:MAG TPA: S8 family serine peptidase, partial [Pyrinomonadaceae bacterium]|nr:S8 family serine peptidase [Pyrinomonadaceae bacterium]